MTQATFKDRLGRIANKANLEPQRPSGAQITPERAAAATLRAEDKQNRPQSWSIFLAVLLGLILVPLSFAARVDTQAVLSPEFGPDVFYYFTALAFTSGFHLLLAGLAIAAMAHRFRHMLLNIVVLEMLIGYGAASVMFATIIQ